MSKRIAVYGAAKLPKPVRQRYWKTLRQRFWKKRKDGIRQRYWKTIKRRVWKQPKGRFKKVTESVRYELSGKGKDLYRSVVQAVKLPPKGFIDVPAEKFLEQPEKYGEPEGEWVERPTVES